MGNKKWYSSKTIWAGIIGMVVVIYNSVSAGLATQCGIEGSFCVTLPAIPEFVFGILGALGIYGRTSASSRIE